MARNRGVEPSAITQLESLKYLLLKTHIRFSARQVMQDNIFVIFAFVYFKIFEYVLNYRLQFIDEIMKLKFATTKTKQKRI